MQQPIATQEAIAAPLDDARREAFAQALARGASFAEATRRAGFAWIGHGKRIARSRDIVERVRAIRAELAGGGSPEMGALVDLLIEAAGEVRRGVISPQAALAARSAYELAAKLKLNLPPHAHAPAAGPLAPLQPTDEEISDEEWMRRYGPPAP